MAFFARRQAEILPDRFEVATENGIVAVDVRRHPRARNYTLRVAGAAQAPILTMPKRGSVNEARRFLERHTNWLKQQIERLPPATTFADGSPIAFRGEMYVIRHDPARRGTVSIDTAGDEPILVVSGDARHIRRRLLDFLKREAKKDIEWAVIRHALKLGVRAKSIRIRDQKSRWGSCSPDGRLSFSWRLIMAPPFVLDYLAAHEVAHLRELNHSARFWVLCKSLSPHSDTARAWLAHNGPALHAIGAEDQG